MWDATVPLSATSMGAPLSTTLPFKEQHGIGNCESPVAIAVPIFAISAGCVRSQQQQQQQQDANRYRTFEKPPSSETAPTRCRLQQCLCLFGAGISTQLPPKGISHRPHLGGRGRTTDSDAALSRLPSAGHRQYHSL